MINRKLDAFGVPPILGYVLLGLAFVVVSNYLFTKTEFAEYLYIFVALGFILKLSEKRRTDFLKTCFKINDYYILRIIENSLIALPFILYLLSETRIISSIILFLLANVLVFFNFNAATNFTIPTPFGKKPFEFTSGFRNTFFVFPIAYFLTYISITVNNVNLGIFSMLLIFIVILSYYSKLENEYYIWSFSQSAKTFLIEKIKTALLFSTVLSLPTAIALALFFPSETDIILIFWTLGYGYLITIILAKYATYPNEISIPQGILIAVSLIFPPLLIGLIPYFYLQSTKRLNTILE